MYADPSMYENQYHVEKRERWIGAGLAALFLVALAGLGFAYWKLSHPAVGPFGAIAMSGTSMSYGSAWGYSDPLTAYKRSLAECNKQTGAGDCQVRVSLKDGCGALVISTERNLNYLVAGNTRSQAANFAMNQCLASGATDCRVQENICSGGL